MQMFTVVPATTDDEIFNLCGDHYADRAQGILAEGASTVEIPQDRIDSADPCAECVESGDYDWDDDEGPGQWDIMERIEGPEFWDN